VARVLQFADIQPSVISTKSEGVNLGNIRTPGDAGEKKRGVRVSNPAMEPARAQVPGFFMKLAVWCTFTTGV